MYSYLLLLLFNQWTLRGLCIGQYFHDLIIFSSMISTLSCSDYSCLPTECLRFHYFPRYSMDSARNDKSPYSSLRDSLHWYTLILLCVYFLINKFALNTTSIFNFLGGGQEWLTFNMANCRCDEQFVFSLRYLH